MPKKINVIFSAIVLALSVPVKADVFKLWNVNYWGKASFQAKLPINNSCNKNGVDSQYFKLINKGSGSAEITLPSTLKPGKAYSFKAFIKADSDTDINIFFRRDDAPYDIAAIRTVQITTEWQQIEFKGIFTPSTTGSVRIAVKEGGAGLCVNSAEINEVSYKEIGSSYDIRVNDSSFFGVHINKLGVHNSWPEFNPGMVRLWDTGTTWALLKPDSSPIDWDNNSYAKRLDYYIRHVKKNNPDAQFIYTMAMTPTKIGEVNAKNCANSSYGFRSCSKPINLEEWRSFTKEMAARYKGVIKYWELWNEADIWFHWNASVQDMVEMAKIANEELKAVDTENVLIGPNITAVGIGFLNTFLSSGGGKYVDAFSVHGYLGRSPSMALNTLRNIRELVNEHGYNLPIWNTETGVSCNPILESCKSFSQLKESYLDGDVSLAIGMISNAALGIKNFSYYTWEGAASDFGGLPLVWPDFKTPTPTSKVIIRIKEWIAGATLQFNYLDNELLGVVSVERKDLKGVIVWAKDQPLNINTNNFPGLNKTQLLRSEKEEDISENYINVTQEPMLIFNSKKQ